MIHNMFFGNPHKYTYIYFLFNTCNLCIIHYSYQWMSILRAFAFSERWVIMYWHEGKTWMISSLLRDIFDFHWLGVWLIGPRVSQDKSWNSDFLIDVASILQHLLHTSAEHLIGCDEHDADDESDGEGTYEAFPHACVFHLMFGAGCQSNIKKIIIKGQLLSYSRGANNDNKLQLFMGSLKKQKHSSHTFWKGSLETVSIIREAL